MPLKDNLKRRREELGMTLEDVAKIVGVTRQTVQKYESGVVSNIPSDKIELLAKALHTTPSALMGWEAAAKGACNIIPFTPGKRVPIYGAVPAGRPVLADELIEGYDYADVANAEDYFFLRVKGDSMKNANIFDGDLVLVQKQPTADDGQIVVCLVNGDEATLKRFRQQGSMVILQPENPAYQPILVPAKEFGVGYAHILGVAREIKRKL